MNKNAMTILGGLTLFSVAASVAEECSTSKKGVIPFWTINEYQEFHSKFIETCRSYVAAVNMLPTRGQHPEFPVMTGELPATALRKTAAQFQDLRLRHDLLTRYTFNEQYIIAEKRATENVALQDMFVEIQKKLHHIATYEERKAIHHWKVLNPYSLDMIVEEFQEELQNIAICNGQFAPIIKEAIATVINPYLVRLNLDNQFLGNAQR